MKYTRRKIFDFALHALSIGAFAGLGIATMFPTLFNSERKRKKFVAGTIEEVFGSNSVAEIHIGEKRVLLFKSADKIVAFDSSCTHGGCPVAWNRQSSTFQCACHGGVFDKQGFPIAGPPKIPLHKLTVTIRQSTDEIIIYVA